MDYWTHLAGRAGLILEIIGTILLASSLAGPERVERWEAKLRDYFDLRFTMSKIIEYSAILAFIIFIIMGCRVATIPFDFPENPFLDKLMIWLFIHFLVVSALTFLLKSNHIEEKYKPTIYMIITLPFALIFLIATVIILVMYTASCVLLSPYLFAEYTSARYNLRPVIGVFGTILILTGLIMQFWL